MPYEVHVEQASPLVLAAVRAVTTPRQLSTGIIRLLDQVWPLLREQGARTGHNVVICHPGEGGEFAIEAGVDVFGDFEERGAVQRDLGGLRRLGRRPGQPADRRPYAAEPRLGSA